MDDAKDCFLLPQTMGSPCTDNTYSEDSSDSTEEMSVNTKPVLSLAELAAAYGQSVRSTVDMSSDDSDVIEVPITNENKSISSFLVGHQEEERLTGESSNTVEKSPSPQPRILRPIVTAQRPLSNVICHNSKIHDKNISRILQKCNSGNAADSKERSCSSEDESWLQPTVHLYRCVVDSDDSDVGHSAVRLKPSQSLGSSRTPRSPLATESRPKSSYRKNVHQESTVHSSLSTQGSRTKPKPPQRSPVKEPRALSSSKAAASKTKNVKRQRKKKQKNVGSSSLFAPQEPEIKLKYANFKHDKRDSRSEDFSPFVHIEQREYLACTVVNYQQEVNDVRENQKQQKLPTGAVSLSGVVPKTSCYRLGRLSSRSKCQPLMMCSLCGGCANAVGLGDLHGPYYPNEPAVQEHCKQQAQKEDQIASEPSVDSKTGLCAQVEENGLRGPCNGPEIDTVDEDCCIIVSDCESSPLPSAKKFRTNGVADSHSPPSVPHNTNERWIHEDCGIWSTDVFLVKGKLYGLEEAVSLAQETVCSTCHATGATMGCIQKGCPNKYHYTCALESGCVLNEENFSMRCPTHKNKTFKGVYMTNTR
ncbi:hypothetical protein DPEC_G00304910 [Dallia pectoralis]|uniref:Uncharacterized protein n=1 Tax=Dallia pectoralis TaxID=75939 RepID=A0ACC2FDP5_DALPE|nr:hypothetical protein DPEC_G00304910 [Dallia pectoralis]